MKIKEVVTLREVANDLNEGKDFVTNQMDSLKVEDF